jgi:hypothetical protein
MPLRPGPRIDGWLKQPNVHSSKLAAINLLILYLA